MSAEESEMGLPNKISDLADRRVLICEDEVWISLDIAAEVEVRGGRVMGPVATVSAGLDALKSEEPDAAIVDVNLIDGESTPILRALMKLSVPTIVVTGNALPDVLAGQDLPVIFKPMSSEKILDALISLLAT